VSEVPPRSASDPVSDDGFYKPNLRMTRESHLAAQALLARGKVVRVVVIEDYSSLWPAYELAQESKDEAEKMKEEKPVD